MQQFGCACVCVCECIQAKKSSIEKKNRTNGNNRIVCFLVAFFSLFFHFCAFFLQLILDGVCFFGLVLRLKFTRVMRRQKWFDWASHSTNERRESNVLQFIGDVDDERMSSLNFMLQYVYRIFRPEWIELPMFVHARALRSDERVNCIFRSFFFRFFFCIELAPSHSRMDEFECSYSLTFRCRFSVANRIEVSLVFIVIVCDINFVLFAVCRPKISFQFCSRFGFYFIFFFFVCAPNDVMTSIACSIHWKCRCQRIFEFDRLTFCVCDIDSAV